MKKSKRYKTPKWSTFNRGKVKPVEREASSWPMFYFKRNWRNQFTDMSGELVSFKIRNPRFIDFYGKELTLVKDTLNNLTDEQIAIAKYFSVGPPTKQWTPIIDRLIDTYNVNPPRAARIIAATHAAINDSFVITWYLKNMFDIARPDQLDSEIEPAIPTPHFPAYPSGHAAVSGCAQVVLSYFFPAEKNRLKEIAEENSLSRLYAGVHFAIDNDEGLRLGRQVGKYVIAQLKKERISKGGAVDLPFKEGKQAVLPPPPYEQVIPFPPPSETNEVPPRRHPFFFI